MINGCKGRSSLAASVSCVIHCFHIGTVLKAALTRAAAQAAVMDLSLRPPILLRKIKWLWQNMFCGILRPVCIIALSTWKNLLEAAGNCATKLMTGITLELKACAFRLEGAWADWTLVRVLHT